eukprot:g13226.t2
MSTIAAPQLLLLTQGIASLGSDNASLMKLVEFWATDEVKLKQLSADQLAKLSQVLAPVVTRPQFGDGSKKPIRSYHQVIRSRMKALRMLLPAQGRHMKAYGKLLVLAAFSGEAPTFEDKEKLLAAVKPREREREKDRDKDQRARRQRILEARSATLSLSLSSQDRDERRSRGRDDRRDRRDDRRRSRSRDRRRDSRDRRRR